MDQGRNMLSRVAVYLINERPIPTILGAAGIGSGSTLIKLIEGVTPFIQFGTLCLGFLTALGGFLLLCRQAYRTAKEDFGGEKP